MARFNFRLQPVLNVRKQLEDNLKNELGKAVRKLEDEKRKLALFESSMEVLSSKYNKKAKKTTVYKLVEFKYYLLLLAEKIKEQKETVNYAAKVVDNLREELLLAVKKRQMMDKLKETKWEAYLLEEKRSEQRMNDEIVAYSFKENGTGE